MHVHTYRRVFNEDVRVQQFRCAFVFFTLCFLILCLLICFLIAHRTIVSVTLEAALQDSRNPDT